jgi:peptide/nickel transport system substrate-binding protein
MTAAPAKRPIVGLPGAVLAVALVASACGSASPTTGPSAATPSAAATAAATAVASASAAAVASASAQASAAAGGKEVDSVVWAGKSSIDSLDPGLVYDSDSGNMATYSECEPLLAFGPTTAVQPMLAASWKRVDATTYVLELRPDVTFWDGAKMTPDDVVFSLSRINDPKLASPLTGLAGTITSVTATGPSEVTIKLSGPDPVLPYKLASPIGQVVEKAFAEKAGATFGTAIDKVMCTGPFKPSSWDKGTKVVMDRVDSYWNPSALPKVKQLTIESVTDSATLVAGLKSGSIDGTFDLDGRNAQALEGDASLAVVSGGFSASVDYLSPNVAKGPFSDLRVRQALSMAIDRTGLAQAVSGKYGTPVKSILPRGFSAWHTDAFNSAYDALAVSLTPDVAGATALVTAAGAQGLKAEVIMQESPTADIVGPAIQQAGASIGLDITIKKMPTSDFYTLSTSGTEPRPFDSLLNYWAADYPDPSALLVVPLSNKYSNVEGWNDASFQTLQNQWLAADPESDAAAQALIGMQKMLTDQTVYIPLYVDPLLEVHNQRIGGYAQTEVWYYQGFAQSLSGN